jgi:hypothetical protein
MSVSVKSVLVPGEREWGLRRHALAHGIELPEDVVEKLRQIASETGIDITRFLTCDPPSCSSRHAPRDGSSRGA